MTRGRSAQNPFFNLIAGGLLRDIAPSLLASRLLADQLHCVQSAPGVTDRRACARYAAIGMRGISGPTLPTPRRRRRYIAIPLFSCGFIALTSGPKNLRFRELPIEMRSRRDANRFPARRCCEVVSSADGVFGNHTHVL